MEIANSFSLNCLCKGQYKSMSVSDIQPTKSVVLIQIFWFKYIPGRISREMLSREHRTDRRGHNTTSLSCLDSTYQTHCHRLI